MSLLDPFFDLVIPDSEDTNVFSASLLPSYPFARIAISRDGYPVVLISSIPDGTHLSQKNIRLTYLELSHNVECSVSEDGISQLLKFTVIIFKSTERYLQTYFLEIAEVLLKKLDKKPTQRDILTTFNSFVEIFRSLTQPPSKTVQGLWSEILIIERSKNPTKLINYWHSFPEEKFDFNADREKIEVKSSSNMNRIHIFSSDQLNPPSDKQVLIASLFTKQSSNGISVGGLIEKIQERKISSELIDKILSIATKTLGNTLEQSLKIKFDYELSVGSLRFYSHKDISKIERINIPDRVSEVKYKSDLTELNSIDLNEIEPTSLFGSL